MQPQSLAAAHFTLPHTLRTANLTLLSANLTLLSANLTLLSANLTLLSANLTLLSANLTLLSANLTLLSANLTFYRINLTLHSVNTTFCGRSISLHTANPTLCGRELTWYTIFFFTVGEKYKVTLFSPWHENKVLWWGALRTVASCNSWRQPKKKSYGKLQITSLYVDFISLILSLIIWPVLRFILSSAWYCPRSNGLGQYKASDGSNWLGRASPTLQLCNIWLLHSANQTLNIILHALERRKKPTSNDKLRHYTRVVPVRGRVRGREAGGGEGALLYRAATHSVGIFSAKNEKSICEKM